MKVEAVELRRVDLPLVRPFRAAHGTVTNREVVVVRIIADTGEGWGECAALPDAGYSTETTSTAYRWLREHAAPRLLGFDLGGLLEDGPPPGPPSGPAPLLDARIPAANHPMARAALESALLDVALRAREVSLASHLGATRTTVASGAALGITRTVDELVAAVGGARRDGYVRVKLKIAPGWDLEPVAAVRHAFPTFPVQVDANGSYTRGDTERLLALDTLDLTCIEQPLPADDLGGHANLARLLQTPIALDESVDSLATAETVLQRGACGMLCLKPGRVGGYETARRIHDRFVDAGVPIWCGGMLETGIGRAAALAVAALPGCTGPTDLAASARYFLEDVTTPFVLHDGHLTVPHGPGLGVEVRPAVLDAATTRLDTVRR